LTAASALGSASLAAVGLKAGTCTRCLTVAIFRRSRSLLERRFTFSQLAGTAFHAAQLDEL